MAFYEDLGGGRWRATEHTGGPWDPGAQHGGPPSALLARAVEQTEPRDDAMVARLTVEILGPVPVGDLALRSQVSRPGRSVELVQAVLSHAGRDVARAEAWRVRRTAGAEVRSRVPTAPPLPDPSPPVVNAGWHDGYLSAMEWRWVTGNLVTPGPATAWARMLHPLVEGETPSGLQRAVILADSGNGASSELDLQGWYFINPELTVHLHREPVGEWVCLDAVTVVSPGGVGLATSVLHDLDGPVGVGAQSLLVQPR